MSDLVSVIVPIYNSEKYLALCIESICKQSYKNLEIILVDDGSTDSSPSICDQFAQKDGRIKVIHKENEGLINARIDGVANSNGKWIVFVDSDDYIETDMYESLLNLANENKAEIVMSGVYFLSGNNTDYRKNATDAGLYDGERLESLKSRMLDTSDFFSFGIQPYLWNKLWKRELISESLGNVDARITVGEDVAIGFPAIYKSSSVVVTDKAYYYYRQSGSSMLSNKKNQDREYANSLRLYSYLKKTISDIGYSSMVNRGIVKYYINQLLTRSYAIVNEKTSCNDLFGFSVTANKPVVIYGAGAFGSTVYEYANQKCGVKCWIDSNATFLSSNGYPIVTLEQAEIDESDNIVVAILKESSARAVKQRLLEYGIKDEQIYLLSISDKLEETLLDSCNYNSYQFPRKFKNCISLGWFCGTAGSLASKGLRSFSGPFDWYWSDLESVLNQIKTNFTDFMTRENLKNVEGFPKQFIDGKYGFHTFHDIEKTLDVDYQLIHSKYVRRANRFIEKIKEPTCFFRAVRSEEEVQYIIKEHNNIDRILKSYNNTNQIIYLLLDNFYVPENVSFKFFHLGINEYKFDAAASRGLFDSCPELLEFCSTLLDEKDVANNRQIDLLSNEACASDIYALIENNDSRVLSAIRRELGIEDKISIWGYGHQGRAMYKYLSSNGINIENIYDSSINGVTTDGIIIKSTDEIEENSKILITIADIKSVEYNKNLVFSIYKNVKLLDFRTLMNSIINM